MSPPPEPKQSVLPKLLGALEKLREWSQQHPLKGPLIAVGSGLGATLLGPLALEQVQKSSHYASFSEAKPVDKLLDALGWCFTGTIPIPVLLIWISVPVVLLVRQRWLKRQRELPAGKKSPALVAEIEDLNYQLEQERKKRRETPTRAKPKEMPNVLNGHPDHYSVISFLFKFKNCTCNDLCRELQLEQSKALKILRDLEITYHLIDRVGQNRHQSTVYALNDNGTKYAAGRKMTPGNQTMSDIWASEAEKELATTRTALADAKRQLADEQAKTAELSHKVSQLTGPKIGILPG